MDSIVQSIKDIFSTAIALGWQPWPTVIATIMMLVLRSVYEPAVLEVNTKEGVERLGKIKTKIFLAVFIVSLLIHIGIARPVYAWDWSTSIGFCVGHTMLAYVISSSNKVKELIKSTIVKEDKSV